MVRKFFLSLLVILNLATQHIVSGRNVCMWCNKAMADSFMNCLGDKILRNPKLRAISRDNVNDMKNSMLAASAAMTRTSPSALMRMLNGALAGEITGMIRSQTLNTGQSADAVTGEIMGMISDCYISVTGESHINFIKDLGKTVDFMLEDDQTDYYSPDTIESNTNDQTRDRFPSEYYSSRLSPPQASSFQSQENNDPVSAINPLITVNYPSSQTNKHLDVAQINYQPDQVNNPFPLENTYQPLQVNYQPSGVNNPAQAQDNNPYLQVNSGFFTGNQANNDPPVMLFAENNYSPAFQNNYSPPRLDNPTQVETKVPVSVERNPLPFQVNSPPFQIQNPLLDHEIYSPGHADIPYSIEVGNPSSQIINVPSSFGVNNPQPYQINQFKVENSVNSKINQSPFNNVYQTYPKEGNAFSNQLAFSLPNKPETAQTMPQTNLNFGQQNLKPETSDPVKSYVTNENGNYPVVGNIYQNEQAQSINANVAVSESILQTNPIQAMTNTYESGQPGIKFSKPVPNYYYDYPIPLVPAAITNVQTNPVSPMKSSLEYLPLDPVITNSNNQQAMHEKTISNLDTSNLSPQSSETSEFESQPINQATQLNNQYPDYTFRFTSSNSNSNWGAWKTNKESKGSTSNSTKPQFATNNAYIVDDGLTPATAVVNVTNPKTKSSEDSFSNTAVANAVNNDDNVPNLESSVISTKSNSASAVADSNINDANSEIPAVATNSNTPSKSNTQQVIDVDNPDSEKSCAMRFAETLFVQISKSPEFSLVLGINTPKSFVTGFFPEVTKRAVRDSGFGDLSDEVEALSKEYVDQLPKSSNSQTYAEKMTKSIMVPMFKIQKLDIKCEEVARSIAHNILKYFKIILPYISSSANRATNAEDGISPSESSNEKQVKSNSSSTVQVSSNEKSYPQYSTSETSVSDSSSDYYDYDYQYDYNTNDDAYKYDGQTSTENNNYENVSEISDIEKSADENEDEYCDDVNGESAVVPQPTNSQNADETSDQSYSQSLDSKMQASSMQGQGPINKDTNYNLKLSPTSAPDQQRSPTPKQKPGSLLMKALNLFFKPILNEEQNPGSDQSQGSSLYPDQESNPTSFQDQEPSSDQGLNPDQDPNSTPIQDRESNSSPVQSKVLIQDQSQPIAFQEKSEPTIQEPNSKVINEQVTHSDQGRDTIPYRSSGQKFVPIPMQNTQIRNQNLQNFAYKEIGDSPLGKPNKEMKEQITILMRSCLNGITDIGYKYNNLTSTMASVSQDIKKNHADWSGEKILTLTYLETIVACTQVLQNIGTAQISNIQSNLNPSDSAGIVFETSYENRGDINIAPVSTDVNANSDNSPQDYVDYNSDIAQPSANVEVPSSSINQQYFENTQLMPQPGNGAINNNFQGQNIMPYQQKQVNSGSFQIDNSEINNQPVVNTGDETGYPLYSWSTY